MASTETRPVAASDGSYRLSGKRLVDAVEPIAPRAPEPSFFAQVAHEIVNFVGWTLLSILAIVTALAAAGGAGLAAYCLWTAAGIESFTQSYYLYGASGLVLIALEVAALVALFRAGSEPREPEFRSDILA